MEPIPNLLKGSPGGRADASPGCGTDSLFGLSSDCYPILQPSSYGSYRPSLPVSLDQHRPHFDSEAFGPEDLWGHLNQPSIRKGIHPTAPVGPSCLGSHSCSDALPSLRQLFLSIPPSVHPPTHPSFMKYLGEVPMGC